MKKLILILSSLLLMAASPSPSPSPLQDKIFVMSDTGNMQAPNTIFVSALPPTPHSCWSDGKTVGPQFQGASDVESNPLQIIHNPRTNGDSTWPDSVINQVVSCIRNRNNSYDGSTSSQYLAGGSILKSSYSWQFGDPGSAFNTVAGSSAAHEFNKPGNYTIRLIITTDKGNVLTGQTQITVKPSTRGIVTVRNQSDWDLLVGDKAIGNRQINILRNAQITQSLGLTLGSNDWVTSPGTGPLPIIWTAFNGSNQKMFNLGDASVSHVQIDSLDIRVKPNTSRPFISEPNASNVTFKDIVLSRGPDWTGVGRGFTLGGNGQLLQNIGAPLDSHGNPQSIGINANFAFMSGTSIALYGNRIFVDQKDGNAEPGVRDCGPFMEDLSIYNNVIGGWWGKYSTISLRDGHKSYVGSNKISGGVFNIQSQCSDAFAPATLNNDTLIENNTLDNTTFHINGDGSTNVLFRNNVSHIWAGPIVTGQWQNPQSLAFDSDPNRSGVSLLNNKFQFDATAGRIFYGDFNGVVQSGNVITPSGHP